MASDRSSGRDTTSPADASSERWRAGWQQTDSLRALREFSDVSRRIMPALARRARLTHTEMAVLEALGEHPVGPTEIADRLGVTTAAASGIVDRLVGHGHAERTRHPDDRRRTVVQLTESGRRELLDHLMPMFLPLARLDAALDDADREVVVRYLTAATAAMRRLL